MLQISQIRPSCCSPACSCSSHYIDVGMLTFICHRCVIGSGSWRCSWYPAMRRGSSSCRTRSLRNFKLISCWFDFLSALEAHVNYEIPAATVFESFYSFYKVTYGECGNLALSTSALVVVKSTAVWYQEAFMICCNLCFLYGFISIPFPCNCKYLGLTWYDVATTCNSSVI